MSDRTYVVGTVPYLNACPLVDWFHFAGQDRGVSVVDAVPSVLAPLLSAGDIVVTQGAGNVGALAGTLARAQLTGGAK